MPIDRMGPLDAGFFHVEDEINQLHIGSVLIMEGPAPLHSELRDHIAGKLPLVPRYRQVVRRVPLDLGRPVWVDDEAFNLENHVRRVALPRPGSTNQLFDLVGRTVAQRLDPSTPLWELCVVEGLDDDRWAIIARVHHCMADGVAGVDLLRLILDVDPEPETPPPTPWSPEPAPSSWDLLADSIGGATTAPLRVGRAMAAGALAPTDTVRRLRGIIGGALSSARALGPLPGSSLIGPIGRNRRWTGTTVPIDQVKAVRRATGASFNDVVLAAITRGFRDLLVLRGEALRGPVRSLVPVSGRPRDERGVAVGDGTFANRVSAFFVDLPVEVGDPVERLSRISDATTRARASGQDLASDLVNGAAGLAPAPLLFAGIGLAKSLPQRNVSVVTTNVPGPPVPLYAAGRRLMRAYPYVPIGLRTRVGIAVLSYDGELAIGVTGDRDRAPDVTVLADGVSAGFSELVGATDSACAEPDPAPTPVPVGV